MSCLAANIAVSAYTAESRPPVLTRPTRLLLSLVHCCHCFVVFLSFSVVINVCATPMLDCKMGPSGLQKASLS